MTNKIDSIVYNTLSKFDVEDKYFYTVTYKEASEFIESIEVKFDLNFFAHCNEYDEIVDRLYEAIETEFSEADVRVYC